MNTLAKINELLYALHQEFPTQKERHSITLNPETHQIEVTVCSGGKWYSFVPGEKDLDYAQTAAKFMRKYIDEQNAN